MKIKNSIKLISVFIFVLFISFIFLWNFAKNTESEILNLHKRSIVLDTHSDTILRIFDKNVDLGIRSSERHIDIPRLIEGGVDVQVFACFIHPRIKSELQIKSVLNMIDALIMQIEKNYDKIELALNVEDIYRIIGGNRIAAMLAVEGGHAIQDDLGVLRQFYRLGVRLMTLTWNNNNNWADSCVPNPKNYGEYDKIKKHGGLTGFGKKVIKEMNRIGMVIDISHSSDDTFRDVIETSTKPVIASHSCAWELSNHPRNIKDDMLKALAKNGGVVGINFYPVFLDSNYEKMSAREKRNNPVTLSKVVDHIDHIVEVAGIDHVGLGSDFDGIGEVPKGLEDCTKFPDITKELVKRNYSEEDIKKILGENFLRVFKEVFGG